MNQESSSPITELEWMLLLYGASYDKHTTIGELEDIMSLLKPEETDLENKINNTLNFVKSQTQEEFCNTVSQAIINFQRQFIP